MESSPLIFSMYAICSTTGKILSKCPQCRHQDLSTTTRKRKKDSSPQAPDIDNENNSQLIQVMPSDYMINHEGKLDVNFRVLCCVGCHSTHKNHMGEEVISEEAHPECLGFSLVVVLSSGVKKLCEQVYRNPLCVAEDCAADGESFKKVKVESAPSPECGEGRAVRKAPAWNASAQFQEFCGPGMHPRPKRAVASEVIHLQNMRCEKLGPGEVTKFKLLKQNTTPPGPPTPKAASAQKAQTSPAPSSLSLRKSPQPSPRARGRLSLGVVVAHPQQEAPVLCASVHGRYTVTEVLLDMVKFPIKFHQVALLYKSKVDAPFPMVFREIFEPHFYEESSIIRIPMESSAMLHLFHVTTVGLILSKSSWVADRALRLNSMAVNLAYHLLSPQRMISDSEMLSLADGISRTGILQGAQGNITTSNNLLEASYKMFEMLGEKQPGLRSHSSFELMMWYRCAFNPRLDIIQQAYEQLESPHLLPFVTFLLITAYIVPVDIESIPAPTVLPLPAPTRDYLLSLCDQLEESVNQVGLRQSSEVKNSNALVYDAALHSLRCLIKNDMEELMEETEECAIQSSLISNPEMDPLPILIGLFSAIQLVGTLLFPQPSTPSTDSHSTTESPHAIEETPPESSPPASTRRMINFVEMLWKSLDTTNGWYCRVIKTFLKNTFESWCRSSGLSIALPVSYEM
eukprot:TRINITY_DN17553_c1_g1_i1.p1 TRINITY_DN17553_c1_g1~~TRINITY_DN17553_c1_g1_i1.p1  ORF type:complete len:745 (-),score=102.87 TRINITY_DN17553_c1_g1_i1:68-2122(-)